jgi:hypothetical protein
LVIFERIGICLCCLLPLLGCGAGAGAQVSGTVTLDGSPLNDATITFVPTSGGQRQAAWATTKNGQYTIAAKDGLGTGEFRVEIRALRPTGEKPNPNEPTMIPTKEAVPSKYNSHSELKAEIKPGQNVANFDLKSK